MRFRLQSIGSRAMLLDASIGNRIASQSAVFVGNGMGFVAARGAGALAIPVLIHLIQRERKRVVEFPSLMFLRKIPVPVGPAPAHPRLVAARDAAGRARAHRAGLRAPLLQAVRAGGGGAERRARSGHPRRHLVQHGVRRSLAEGEVRRDRRHPGLGAGRSRVAGLLLVGRRSRRPLRRPIAGASRPASPRPRPDPGATRFAPALKLAGSLLGESALPRREIILISDFQRRGWEQTPGRDDVKLPERTTLTPVNVAVRRDGQPLGDARVAAADAVRESRSGRRDRRRRQSRQGSRSPARRSRSKSTATPSSRSRPTWPPADRAA